MSARQIVVIGSGPAALATVRGYRDAGGDGALAIVGEEPQLPYERPPLTKEFLRGESDRDELVLERSSWYDEQSVELHLGSRAVRIDPARGEVVLESGARLPADACVLATGARPLRPPLPGAEHDDVLEMRRVGDSERLAARAATSDRAVVVGSGFIGCEAAASLALLGLEVTIVTGEELPQKTRLGFAAGAHIADWLRDAGVTLLPEVEVRSIEDARGVRLADGPELAADLVLLATGVTPNGDLATDVGLELRDGAVPVDSSMRSLHPFISAAGDVARAQNELARRPLRVEHWGDALAQGEVAGRALAGQDAVWEEVPGFWSTIGSRTLKHAAWGDGFDDARAVEHDNGAFTVWYTRAAVVVGVLTHERDEDYDRGRRLIAHGESL
jgi:3-phenylpropionate/trans-cinnamate dioxygenase ferredoxin reductase subunit